MTRPQRARGRIKRCMITALLVELQKTTEGMSRSDLERHFEASHTTIQSHVTAMRKDSEIYIGAWREPEKTGMWSPVYMLCTEAKEEDVPHPTPPRHRWRKFEDVDAESDEPIVVQGSGIKPEHAAMAKSRFATLGLGMWGALVSFRRASAPQPT